MNFLKIGRRFFLFIFFSTCLFACLSTSQTTLALATRLDPTWSARSSDERKGPRSTPRRSNANRRLNFGNPKQPAAESVLPLPSTNARAQSRFSTPQPPSPPRFNLNEPAHENSRSSAFSGGPKPYRAFATSSGATSRPPGPGFGPSSAPADESFHRPRFGGGNAPARPDPAAFAYSSKTEQTSYSSQSRGGSRHFPNDSEARGAAPTSFGEDNNEPRRRQAHSRTAERQEEEAKTAKAAEVLSKATSTDGAQPGGRISRYYAAIVRAIKNNPRRTALVVTAAALVAIYFTKQYYDQKSQAALNAPTTEYDHYERSTENVFREEETPEVLDAGIAAEMNAGPEITPEVDTTADDLVAKIQAEVRESPSDSYELED